MKRYKLIPDGEKRGTLNLERDLNEAQREAALHREKPLLVIAGAGSGKTRTLIYRVACLISDGVDPESILLLTFTRKAAEEMLRRAALMTDARCEKVAGGTYHSFANGVLRQHAHLIGYGNNFTILDRGDSIDLVGLVREELGYSGRTVRFPRKETVGEIISKSINKSCSIEDVILSDFPHFSYLTADIEKIAVHYNRMKQDKNLMDYDDLLINLLRILTEFPEVRDALSNRYRFIMIDEFQDTNRLQAEISYLLAEKHRNIMAVGDDSQSIYSFRGADFRNIMDFPGMFPDTRIIYLEENYRSTQPILDLTNIIIERAVEKFPKKLFTRKKGGDPPWIVASPNEKMQSLFVADKILELYEEDLNFKDMAVLFRASFLSFDLEIELAKRNIPYRKFGGFKFMETTHIKDVLSILRIIANPFDEISSLRAFKLAEGIGKKKAGVLARRLTAGEPIRQVAEDLARGKRSEDCGKLSELLLTISRDEMPPVERIQLISNFYRPVMEKKFDDYPKRLKDLEQLEVIAERYRSLQTFLTDITLEPIVASVADVAGTDRESDYLTLSTIHSAKGLEWNTVFIIWVLDGRIPSLKSLDDPYQLEEERRLLYVAATRAKQNLFFSSPVHIFDRQTQSVLSKPSRFIEGIPPHLLPRYTLYEYE
ncbi:MAG: UvrD-helicase domain-containing protein [Deltaproteobacteria bacterium]|nr:UvrD-helicase domain-containing protein [Deltaproteobacteria bacterium]